MNSHLMAALAAAFALAPFATAKVPPLLAVPGNVAPSARTELTAQHDTLAKRLADLRKWSVDYNANCGNRDLPANDPRTADCLAQKAKLDEAGQAYTRDVEAYNDAVLSRSALGGVAEIRGDVRITRPDNRVVSGSPAAAAATLNYGTRIETGADGHVRATLHDGATLVIGANAQIAIDPAPDATTEPTPTVSAMRGVLRWIGAAARATGVPERCRVRIPTAVIAVRGTEFEVRLAPDGSGSIALFSGALSIVPSKGGQPFDLSAGQAVSFKSDGSWSAPRSLTADRPSV